VGSVGCKKGCREKTSTTARDNMGKNEPTYKTVTRSTDSSRMSYFFFIIELTSVLAVAVQGNQGRHFLWNNRWNVTNETRVQCPVPHTEQSFGITGIPNSSPWGKTRLCNPPLTIFLVFWESGCVNTRNLY